MPVIPTATATSAGDVLAAIEALRELVTARTEGRELPPEAQRLHDAVAATLVPAIDAVGEAFALYSSQAIKPLSDRVGRPVLPGCACEVEGREVLVLGLDDAGGALCRHMGDQDTFTVTADELAADAVVTSRYGRARQQLIGIADRIVTGGSTGEVCDGDLDDLRRALSGGTGLRAWAEVA